MSIEPSPYLEIEENSSPAAVPPEARRISDRSHFAKPPLIVPGAITPPALNGHSRRRELSPALREKVKELIQLAREQGYLSREDLQEGLGIEEVSPEDLQEIQFRLKILDIDVVDSPNGHTRNQESKEEEANESSESFDDPVRMYLKEMGQVKLLSREEEVEISKRIEQAEQEIKT